MKVLKDSELKGAVLSQEQIDILFESRLQSNDCFAEKEKNSYDDRMARSGLVT